MAHPSTPHRQLRIGVLGCGPIAQAAHFDACRKAHNAELYAVCDQAPELLAEAERVHRPLVAYGQYAQMLADPQVEAVLVAAADQFHVDLAGQALAAGKHVLVEKPLGVDVESCEALRRQVETTGLVLQVGTNKRFDPGVAFAARFVQERLGERHFLRAWYCDSTYRYTMTDNLQPLLLRSPQAVRPAGDPKAHRRRYLLLTHGSHLLDTARLLGGPLVSVQAQLLERSGAYCWLISAQFADGSAGQLNLTVAVQGDWDEGFAIYGAQGSATGKSFLPWHHRSSEVACFSAADGQFHRPLGADAYTYKLQIEGFAATILDGAPQWGATVEDGLAAVRALVAIARSSESGRPVHLADITGAV